MANTNIPNILQQLNDTMQEQLKLLQHNSQHAQQMNAMFANRQAAHFGSLVGGNIQALLPPALRPLAGAAANVFSTGHAAVNAIATARMIQQQQQGGPPPPGGAPPPPGGGGPPPNPNPSGPNPINPLNPMINQLGVDALGGAGGALIGSVAVGFVALKAALYDAPKALYDWTHSLLESQKYSAQFSPQLSAIFLGLQAREQVRERGFGAATADTTDQLASAMARMQDELVPLRTVSTNIANTLGTQVLSGMTEVIALLNRWLPEVAVDEMTDFEKFQGAGAHLDEERRENRRQDIRYDPFRQR